MFAGLFIATATWLAVDGGLTDVAPAVEAACPSAPVYREGQIVQRVCLDRPAPDLTVLDLGDDWTPALFSETPGHPQFYRATYQALANQRLGTTPGWETAGRDRYFELYGISPSVSIARGRLLDEPRHACHASVDDQPLRAVRRTITPWDPPSPSSLAGLRNAALTAVQAHLVCDGLLDAGRAGGVFDQRTADALALYQRRHMIPSPAVVEGPTRDALLTDSRELDFRALLRVLRERLVDATGLIEDGSASHGWAPVLGRFIDAAEYRPRLRPSPLAYGAPDLIDPATEAAARALGWTSPAAAASVLRGSVPAKVAVALPPVPAYHSAAMSLRVEIDRGDVWRGYPLDDQGRPRASPARDRPTLVLYARIEQREVALVRWPTTIGAWKKEKLDDDSVALRYKASPTGRFYWRDLVASPAWFPPPSTPDDELVRRGRDGRWVADQEAVGPGYRSAYGLVALMHHYLVSTGGGGAIYGDDEIRTHGSGNYRSILRGSSHGCHRLFNHLAVRLAGFLLAHREIQRDGLIAEGYRRTLQAKNRTFVLRVPTRGYRFVLDPPVPVDVLPGRFVGRRANPSPAPRKQEAGPAGGPSAHRTTGIAGRGA